MYYCNLKQWKRNQDINTIYKKRILNQDGKCGKSRYFEDKLFEINELRGSVKEHFEKFLGFFKISKREKSDRYIGLEIILTIMIDLW